MLEEMMPYLTDIYGNPNSDHLHGKAAKEGLEYARTKVAQLIGASSDEIIFSSGSTESINHIIKGLYFAQGQERNHIITVKTEHKAVLASCEWLESIGAQVTYLDVDTNGLLDEEQLKEALKKPTLLVSVMHVNNETGVIHDIESLASKAHEAGAYFFSDCTQSAGKIPLHLAKFDLDFACFNAHKMGGPKGIGVTYIKEGVEIQPLIHGGSQEKNRRGGTSNVAFAVGFAKALELALKLQKRNLKNHLNTNKELVDQLQLKGVHIHGREAPRSPYILSLGLNGIEANTFLEKHSTEISASTGSACNVAIVEVSHVLRAMESDYLDSTIRVSMTNDIELEQLQYVLSLLK